MLREVTTLSRLNHQYVVRYYQAWTEPAGDVGESFEKSNLSAIYLQIDANDTHRGEDAGNPGKNSKPTHANLQSERSPSIYCTASHLGVQWIP